MKAGTPIHRFLSQPGLGAVAGAGVVWLLFALLAGAPFRSAAGTAAYLDAAAPLGILAVAVALLMIGGEFDLSIGSVVGFAGMALLLLTRRFGWDLWPALGATFVLAAAVGLLNGWLVVRTRIPSFLVTLGTLFVFRGLTVALARAWTGRTQLGGLDEVRGYGAARAIFATDVAGFDVAIAWWAGAAILATWLLFRTAWGNRVLATGGRAEAARSQGVPVARVKITLFVTTALAAWLVAVLQATRYTGTDALRGELQEFRAIAAAVIGGTLLTGGHGSPAGASLGALVFGMVQQGIVILGVDADWFQVFLGAVLLAAVVFNEWVRRRALSGR